MPFQGSETAKALGAPVIPRQVPKGRFRPFEHGIMAEEARILAEMAKKDVILALECHQVL